MSTRSRSSPGFHLSYLLTLNRLSKSRRKRPVPEGWATGDAISAYKPAGSTDPLFSGANVLSVNSSGDSALVQTSEGTVGVFSLPQKQVLHTLETGGAVTDALWAGEKAVVASSTGSVTAFESGKEVASFKSHAGAVTGLALHATGDIVGSVGADKSYVLYDLTTNAVIMQNFSDTCQYSAQTCTWTPADILLFSPFVGAFPP